MKYSLLALFFIPCFVIAQSNYLNWGYRMGNSGGGFSNSISADAAGNLYTGFIFEDTIDADPGPGVQQLISKGSYDACIARYDAFGNLIWNILLGGPGYIEPKVLAIPSGGVFVSGIFNDSLDLDPGPDSLKIGEPGTGLALFIARYTADGQLLWGKKITSGATGFSLTDYTLDISGNLYLTGVVVGGAVDFDPGPGTYNLGNGGNNAEFVLKLTNTGNFVWARIKTSTGDGWSMAWSIGVDAAGNVYTTGMFHGTVDMNSGAGVANFTSNGYFNSYLSKWDAAGNFSWAFPVSTGPIQDEGRGLVIDGSGNVFVTGLFNGTSDFDPGPAVTQLTASGNTEGYLAKYSQTGALLWVKKIISGSPGTVTGVPYLLRQDGSGNLYSAGYFYGDADFDPSASVFTLSGSGFLQTYIQKLTGTGDLVWAGKLTSNNSPSSLSVDYCGAIYLAGGFTDSADAEPGPGTYTLRPEGSGDFYFLKLSQSYWTGAVSTDWHNPLNWSCNTVPGAQSNVVIPAAVPRFPIVLADAEIKSINLHPDASIQVETGVVFNVNGVSQ